MVINHRLIDNILGKYYFWFFVCKPITIEEKLEKYNKRLTEMKKQEIRKEDIIEIERLLLK